MQVNQYYSIEGISGAGKSTLISLLKDAHSDLFYYPQRKHEEEFESFVEQQNISLKPLETAPAQNAKFGKFLAFEADKLSLVDTALSNHTVVSDRDYLSCFSAGYTHAVVKNTGNERFIRNRIEWFRDQPFFRPPDTRFYLDLPVKEAIRRKTRRGDGEVLTNCQRSLVDYLQIQQDFEKQYISEMEPERTVYLNGLRATDDLFRTANQTVRGSFQ